MWIEVGLQAVSSRYVTEPIGMHDFQDSLDQALLFSQRLADHNTRSLKSKVLT
jgi:hypothetical protein